VALWFNAQCSNALRPGTPAVRAPGSLRPAADQPRVAGMAMVLDETLMIPERLGQLNE
jgi:hypothetical protein